jgi:Homeodomain-like domain
MHLSGQTTSFQVRLEIMEQASAGLNDTQIATALGCSVWTVRKWRRRSLKFGHVGLASRMGCPATGPVSTFPHELKEAVLHLRTLHPGWGPNTLLAARKHGCLLVQSAAAESSANRQAPQTSRLDASLSTSSGPDPTTSDPPHFSAPGMANGRGIRLMRVEGVGKVSLISIVDVTSRRKRRKLS